MSEILDVVFGFNPLDIAAGKFAGDWEAYVNAANAWKSLAGASGAISRNVKAGLQEVDATWDGHAADSAYVHFDQVVTALHKQGDVLVRAHGKFMLAGEGVWREGKSIADILKMIGDLALLAAVEIAAGTALAETVVGPALLYSLAALEIIEMIRLWQTATNAISNLQTVVNFTGGAVQQLLSELGDIQRVPVPGSPFDHPAVS